MLPREFQYAVEGYIEERKEEYRIQMEAARLSGYLAAVIHIPANKRKSMEKMLPFPWEKQDTTEDFDEQLQQGGIKKFVSERNKLSSITKDEDAINEFLELRRRREGKERKRR